jgi:general L-amino acid transport system permease protein
MRVAELRDTIGVVCLMSGATLDPRLVAPRAAPKRKLEFKWSDPRFRSIVWQIVIIGTIALIVWYLAHNTSKNLQARRIATGFGFLNQAASIPIGESLLDFTSSVSTYGRALLIGVLNTLKLAIVGVVLATILGTLVGIGRLSPNWLVSRITGVYVETLRNIPLLLQLFFWAALLQTLPAPRQSFHPLPGVFLSNRGIKIPTIDWELGHLWVLAAFVAGLIGTFVWSRAATRKQDETGVRPKVWPVGIALLIAFPAVVWAVLQLPATPDVPELRGFNFVGGMTVTPEYGAMLIGLVLYTATYIAEIVRTGILAVPQGQWEAAGAVGLHRSRVLRLIVLPQALRVIVPPMTSQYLNLIKNSSLGVAIGYAETVSIASTTLNQTGQAIEGIAIIMCVYLAFSLSISLFMNWYNARIALVER